jgi:flagellar hook-length control protein FliK
MAAVAMAEAGGAKAKQVLASSANAAANTAAGADNGSEGARSVDGKRKDKRKERLDIEVFDLRRQDGSSALKGAAAEAFGAEKGLQSAQGAENGTDIVVTLRGEHAGTGDRAFEAASRGQSPTSFSDALARELREVYNADIVQRASVTLKDGGDGLIRLSLKPESLGAVKIKLELADNKIAGRILVETDEALKAFGKELRSLEQAFVDGGFDGASLELALSSGDSGQGTGNRGNEDYVRPFFSERAVVSEYDAAVPSADYGDRSDAVIDMLA